ncbi:MAG: geranylgeranylglyceryl/heptaprenylglyceryl phosphate synthase [Candidatus Aenigmarchaeota archaeon]|nr:geranylgeranylglyceryl/heptaprenylglyceryl phosphate synthase [Candidatus Aenigmarchaeota archaeon]
MRVEEYINKQLRRRKLHFPLIDPDPGKNSIEKIRRIAEMLEEFGSDAVLVGGSTGVEERSLDRAIAAIKKHFTKPVILYPGSAQGISRRADGILFMSLLNSSDPLWISGMQAAGAPAAKKYKIEPLPMAYLIVEPGMKAGEVGKAKLLRKADEAVSYALAAQYMGMRFVYLEAGSGAYKTVPDEMIRSVRKETDVKLIVGGGIRDAETAKQKLRAGADIIVTGTVLEDSGAERIRSIVKAIHGFKSK